MGQNMNNKNLGIIISIVTIAISITGAILVYVNKVERHEVRLNHIEKALDDIEKNEDDIDKIREHLARLIKF